MTAFDYRYEALAPEAPFSVVFSRAMRGEPCAVVGLDSVPSPLPMHQWVREADADDLALLALCEGPTLDVGCGPGRLTSALARSGQVALGIDVVLEAVDQTRSRGGAAVLRNVYDALPGEGRWRTALLADGNLGIGGDPVALLRRAREVIEPGGRVVVEVHAPGTTSRTVWATLECATVRSRPFRWSVLSVDDVDDVAGRAGLRVSAVERLGERWAVVLQEPM